MGTCAWGGEGNRIKGEEEGLLRGAPFQSHIPSSHPARKLRKAAHPVQVLGPRNREESDGRIRVKALLGVHGVEAAEFLSQFMS